MLLNQSSVAPITILLDTSMRVMYHSTASIRPPIHLLLQNRPMEMRWPSFRGRSSEVSHRNAVSRADVVIFLVWAAAAAIEAPKPSCIIETPHEAVFFVLRNLVRHERSSLTRSSPSIHPQASTTRSIKRTPKMTSILEFQQREKKIWMEDRELGSFGITVRFRPYPYIVTSSGPPEPCWHPSLHKEA
jgi:hypothetical protein